MLDNEISRKKKTMKALLGHIYVGFKIQNKGKCAQNIINQPKAMKSNLFLSGINALPIGGAAPTFADL